MTRTRLARVGALESAKRVQRRAGCSLSRFLIAIPLQEVNKIRTRKHCFNYQRGLSVPRRGEVNEARFFDERRANP